MFTRNQQIKYGVTLALVAATGAANAAAMTVPEAITDALASVGVIGLAVFGVYVAVKTFKWIKGAL